MRKTYKPFKGRGASSNLTSRFEKIKYIADDREIDDLKKPKTTFYKDTTKTILTYNDSPDTGFLVGINPYRGCEHGCIYCYARPTHEFYGLSSGLDFETHIFVKENAPELLKKELSSNKWNPQTVVISGNTDCYQPAEKQFKLTRRCLEVFLEFKNPVGIITKNHLITRDIDILKGLSEINATVAILPITTLDSELAGKMEPRTSRPYLRLKALEKLSEAGIPTMVLVAPVIPGLTDHEIPKIIEKASNAGASRAAYIMLRLPHTVSDLFIEWIENHFPNRKNKILNRIISVRKGKLSSSEFGSRMVGEGILAKHVKDLFNLSCRKNGINKSKINLSAKHFKNPYDKQQKLFSHI